MNWRSIVMLLLAMSARPAGAGEAAGTNAPSVTVPRPDDVKVAVKATSNAPPQPVTGPARLEQSTHLVLDTNAIAATAAGTNAPTTKEKSFTWNVEWKGWDGLQFEAVQKTPLKNPMEALGLQPENDGPKPFSHLHLEQVKMSGTFGGRLEVDAAAFVTTGDLTGFDPGVELRRLRVSLGGDCILVLPVSYYLDLGYNSGGFYLDKAYLNFPAGRFLGSVQIGQFQSPMGLELITSSRDIAFMDPPPRFRRWRPASKPASKSAGPSSTSGRRGRSASSPRAPALGLRHRLPEFRQPRCPGYLVALLSS